MSVGVAKPELFLLSQRLRELRGVDDSLRRKRLVCGSLSDEEAGDKKDVSKDPWHALKRELVAAEAAGSSPLRRVALVCDAGLGKSTNMAWLAAEIARASGGHQVPLLVRLEDSLDFAAVVNEHARREGGLLDRLAGLVNGAAKGPVGQQRRALERLQDAGRVTLLIDGLDHALGDPTFPTRLREVLSFAHWRNCPVWVSGRPYAFEQCWKELFAGDDWTFRQVDPLDAAAVRFYLVKTAGGDWYDVFPPETWWLLAVPRLLRLVCGIIRTALHATRASTHAEKAAIVRGLDLKTPADVYYRAFFETGDYFDRDSQGLLAQGAHITTKKGIGLCGIEPSETNHGKRVRRAGVVLGVIAFEMHAMTAADGRREPNTRGVDLDPFQDRVAARLVAAGEGNLGDFDRDLNLLQQMNNLALEFLVFREASDKRLVFHDRTVQAFFAAYWAMTFGTPTDRKLLQTWIVDEKEARLPGYAEFWTFAAQLPDKLVDRERWRSVFSPCYTPPGPLLDRDGWVQWSREMICHSIGRMERRGTDILKSWRSGRMPTKALVEWFMKDLRSCPPDPTTGVVEFWMGSPPDEPGRFADESRRLVAIMPFRMQDFPVTNGLYEQFDPGHESRRDEVSSRDEQPVVTVSYWDARAFAWWLGDVVLADGSRWRLTLPVEEQWEFACRAGTPTPFWFGSKSNGQEANFNGNHPYEMEDTGPYLERTVAKGEGAYRPNPWGLWHVHGNVYEWCDSRYEPGASSRVVRGGSWGDDGGDCRSALRDHGAPASRDQSVGFRLAAVPLEPSRASEAE